MNELLCSKFIPKLEAIYIKQQKPALTETRGWNLIPCEILF